MKTLHNPLQDLDQIQAGEDQKRRTLEYVQQKSTHKSFIYKQLAIVASVMILCFFSYAAWSLSNPKNTAVPTESLIAAVTFDINPSIEFQLDDDLNIIQMTAFNEEAQQIIDSLSISNVSFEEGIEALIQNANYSDYLKQGILEIGVYANDSGISQQLEDIVNTYLSASDETLQYHCAQIDEETFERANQHHTSAGKYRVIELIQSYDASVLLEDLSKMNMKELYAILETYDSSAVPETCQSNQEQQQNQHHGNKGKHGN